ncbi:MAG: hypothetical protein MZV70_42020 [Desulfobacterales bacterium]|nr:hypothetical protein [Desulfobacterales bacterium]
MNIAVILDEYGTTIGIVTLNDIFRGILGELRTSDLPLNHIGEKQYYIKGRLPVEEINGQLGLSLPERKKIGKRFPDYLSIITDGIRLRMRKFGSTIFI